MQLSYEYQGELFTIKLERQADGMLRAQIEDREYLLHASELTSGKWLLRINGERSIAYTAQAKEARYVQVDGVQYQLERTTGNRRKRQGQAGASDLKAEMPGQVIDVRVQVGDSVSAGQVLVVLEAMKMEIRITAPAEGIVKRLLVKTGEVVERGHLLVELTSTDQST